MTKKNGVNHSMQLSVQSRRKSVIARLGLQLVAGVKESKQGVLPLTDSDRNRINKEIEVLKTRI